MRKVYEDLLFNSQRQHFVVLCSIFSYFSGPVDKIPKVPENEMILVFLKTILKFHSEQNFLAPQW